VSFNKPQTDCGFVRKTTESKGRGKPDILVGMNPIAEDKRNRSRVIQMTESANGGVENHRVSLLFQHLRDERV